MIARLARSLVGDGTVTTRWDGWTRATELHASQLADALGLEEAGWPELVAAAARVAAQDRLAQADAQADAETAKRERPIQWLDLRQAAMRVGLSYDGLRFHVAKGNLAVDRSLGWPVRIDRSELDRFAALAWPPPVVAA